MSLLSAVAALAILAVPLRAGGAQVTLSASSATATVGERIELRVVVQAEPGVSGIRVAVPPGAYEVVQRRLLPMTVSGDRRTFAEIITIAFFQTGDFTIGPFQVELLPAGPAKQASESTGQLAIRVRSLLGENDKDIQPLKELLALRGDFRHLLPYAAALLVPLLLVAAFLLLRRQRRRMQERRATPPLPPELELEQDIHALRGRNLWSTGEFRHFFIVLSGVLKRFIERAYGFNAGECTTAETLAGLGTRENDAGIIAGLEEIFTLADLVKFARRVPAPEAEAGIWKRIDALIAEHRKRRRLAEEAAHVPPGR